MNIYENQDPVKIMKIGMILIVFSSPPLEETAIAFAFPFTLSNCLVIVNDDDDQSCEMSQIWQIYLCKNIGMLG